MMKSLFIALLIIIACLNARENGPLFKPKYYYSRDSNNGSTTHEYYYSRNRYYRSEDYSPYYSRDNYYSSTDYSPYYSRNRDYYSRHYSTYYSRDKYYSSSEGYYSSGDYSPNYSRDKYYSPYYSRDSYYSSEDDWPYSRYNSRHRYYSSRNYSPYFSRSSNNGSNSYRAYYSRNSYYRSADYDPYYSRDSYYRSREYSPYYSRYDYYSSEDELPYHSRYNYYNSRYRSRGYSPYYSRNNYYSSEDDLPNYSRYNYYRSREYSPYYSSYNYYNSEDDLPRYYYSRDTNNESSSYRSYYSRNTIYSSGDYRPHYSRDKYYGSRHYDPYCSTDSCYSTKECKPYYSRRSYYNSECDDKSRSFRYCYSKDNYYCSERSRPYYLKDDYESRHFGYYMPQHLEYREGEFEFHENILPEPLKEDVPCTGPNCEEYTTVKEFPVSKVNDSNILISIITSTYTPRHKFHKNLYFAFLKQKIPENYYPIPKWNETEIELLVYDNWYSEDGKEKMHPSPFFTAKENLDETGNFKDRRVKYKFFNYSMSIGEKRNIMAKEAKGKYVIHMDDDDFFDEDYVADSLNTLLSYDERTILVIRLKYFEYDIVWNNDLQRIESNYFYVVSRRKSENWAFAWVYKNEPFQFYMNTEHEPCTYEHTSFAEEDIMAQCLEMKQPGSVVKHDKLSTAFVKVDTGTSGTSKFRPSLNGHEASLIELKVNYASEVNALMSGYHGYCKLLNHVQSNMKED